MKQLKFNKKEQNIITNSLKEINQILIEKMNAGVKYPCLEGNMIIEDEPDINVFFTFNVSRNQ